MNRRPICLVCIGWMIVLWILKAAGAPLTGAPSFPDNIRKKLEKGCVTCVTGEVESRRKGDQSIQYILNNSYATVCGKKIHLSKIHITATADTRRSVLLYAQKKETEVFPGDSIRAVGNVRVIGPPSNPGQFDSRAYYAAQKIYFSMYAQSLEIKKAGRGFWKRLALRKEETTEALAEVMSRESAGVVSAMILGDKSLLSGEIRTDFIYGGVMHILAISGLHITMLGMLLYGLLLRVLLPVLSASYRRKAKAAAALFSFLLMGLYVLFTGMALSALRAWIMYGVLLFGQVLEKSYDSLCALALAALLLLITNPDCMFYAGFQLSFAAVAGAAAVYPALLSYLPEKFWRKGSRKKQVLERMLEAVLAYLAVMLATVPLVAWYFCEIPLYAPLANLLVVPLLPLVMMAGITGSLFLTVSVRAGSVLLVPLDFLLQVFFFLTGSIRRLPFAMWICGQPDFRQMVVYYLLLVLLVFYRRGRAAKKPGIDLLLAALLTVSFFVRLPRPFGITMLDVGQGDCSVIRTEEGAYFLVDGGSSSKKHVGEDIILPYLKQQGAARLEGIFLSHADEDHINGVEELLEMSRRRECSVRIGRVWMPAWMRQDAKGKELVLACQKAHVPVSFAVSGCRAVSGSTGFLVLHPFAKGGAQEGNAGSMVLEISCGKFRALFPGDLEGPGEREVLPAIRRVHLLKVAHHGSAYSSAEAFLARAGAPVSLISSAEHSIYHHPHKETLERLRRAGSRYFCTKDAGAVLVTVKDGKMTVREYKKERKKH